MGFPGDSGVKNTPANAGDVSSIPESGRSPEEENGNPLQYFLFGKCQGQETGGLVNRVAKKSDMT